MKRLALILSISLCLCAEEHEKSFLGQYVNHLQGKRWVAHGDLMTENGGFSALFHPKGSSQKKMENSIHISYFPGKGHLSTREAIEMEKRGVHGISGRKLEEPYLSLTKTKFSVLKDSGSEALIERRYSFRGGRNLSHSLCRLVRNGNDWICLSYKKKGSHLKEKEKEMWIALLGQAKADFDYSSWVQRERERERLEEQAKAWLIYQHTQGLAQD